MKRYKSAYREEAITDLEEIQDYLDQNAPDQCDVTIGELVSAIRSLEYLPKRNRERFPRKTPGLTVYALPALKYLIYYRVDDDEEQVRILTVRHTSRRPRKRFPS